ncbi:MAG: hypothetical protein A2Z43_05245 [Syntrophobacterales bacterium RBG_19FT_COMBO_59_10]|nr:MAG: hypothetical protein A2Z43_05245 [Syntrophobacterales bacterium RBG_19FT_COMBO_59_10]
MSAFDRDLRVGCIVAVFGCIVSWVSFTLPMRGEFIESPGIFPGLMGVLLILCSFLLIVRSLKKGGRVRLAQWGRSVIPFMTSPDHRTVLLGVLLPAIYIFVGIPLIGFYLSSALFLAIMFWFFVKRWRRWFLFLPVAVVLTVLLYLIFNKLFMLQIR